MQDESEGREASFLKRGWTAKPVTMIFSFGRLDSMSFSFVYGSVMSQKSVGALVQAALISMQSVTRVNTGIFGAPRLNERSIK